MKTFQPSKIVRLAGLSLLLATTLASAAPCDDVESLRRQRAQLTAQADALERARPFIEQFGEVKRAIDGVHEVLRETKGDLKETRKQVDELLGKTREQNAELRNVRRWARGVNVIRADFEPTSSNDRKPLTMSDGLKQSEEWIGQLEKDAQAWAKMMAVLEDAVRAREGRPSEQLEAFRSYLGALSGSLDKFKDVAPPVRLMQEMFKYYDEAIKLITVSVRQIEAEYTRRDEILRQLGPEYNNVRYHWPRTTPWERLARQKREVEREIGKLDLRLRECGVNPDARPPAAPEPDDTLDMRRARQTAERNCAPRFGVRNHAELLGKRDEAVRVVQRFYARPASFPAAYGPDLSVDEEMDLARKRHQRWVTEKLMPVRTEVAELQRSVAATERRFEQYRRREIKLSSDEAARLNVDRQEKTRRLEFVRTRLAEGEQHAQRREKALAEFADLQARQKSYESCLRAGLEDLARRLDWSMAQVRRTHPDLYTR